MYVAQRSGFAAHGRPRRYESALQNPQGALRAPRGAHRGAPGAVGFAALSPHLGRPRTAVPCTVFGVGFAVGVDFEQCSYISYESLCVQSFE